MYFKCKHDQATDRKSHYDSSCTVNDNPTFDPYPFPNPDRDTNPYPSPHPNIILVAILSVIYTSQSKLLLRVSKSQSLTKFQYPPQSLSKSHSIPNPYSDTDHNESSMPDPT